MFRIISSKRLMLFVCLGLLMCGIPMSLAQDNAKPFVRLATYWDTPGVVTAVSADDHWIVIYDLNDNTSRVVEVATGKVQATNPGQNSVHFSPSGRFVTLYASEKQSTQIFDLSANKLLAEIPGFTAQFGPDESLAMGSIYDSEDATTTVVNTKAGTILLMAKGRGDAFSPKSDLLAAVSLASTSVIEVATGKVVFDFPKKDFKEGQDTNATDHFSPDGSLFSVSQASNSVSYVFDTATWQLLYQVDGSVLFSPDSRFLTARNDNDPSVGVMLVDAKTGKQTDTVKGDMWFSDDGKLLYRMDRTNCVYYGATQVIDLATMKPLVDIKDCGGVQMLVNNTVARVSSGGDTSPIVQQFIDVATGKEIWRVEADAADIVDLQQHLVTVTHHAAQTTFENFDTGEVIAASQEAMVSISHQYVFASNGLFVDVYGAPALRVDTMPTPRVGGGIVQVTAGKINVYPMPTAANAIESESPNPVNFYVMGKSSDEKWLYVVYTDMQEYKRKQGWIANDNLTVIADWKDAPVLSADDPLADLQKISGT